ncbi:MAG: TIGR03086 family metal-binding protein [Actinomycetota bacterium]|nr:TIGR03086 family metal-binding protein [Actinomycetota bacterium]
MALEPVAALRRAHHEFSTRLGEVRDDLWVRQSACEDWSVGDLVDHVIGGNVFTVAVIRGAGAEEAMASAIKGAESGVDDRVDAYESSAAEMLALFGSPGALGGVYHHVVGDVPGTVVVALRTNDITLHAWDLARSGGFDEQLDPGLVRHVWDKMSPNVDELAAGDRFGSGSRGDLPDDAPLQARLLDITGRR